MSEETKIDIRSAINAKMESDALQFKYRRLAHLEEVLRDAGAAYSPEDLKKEAYEFNVLKDVADGIIDRYENLINADARTDDGEVPIRFVDYAHGEVVRLWTAVSIELGKGVPVLVHLAEDPVKENVVEDSIETIVINSEDTDDVPTGKVVVFEVGAIAIGVAAGIALTLRKNRKSKLDA